MYSTVSVMLLLGWGLLYVVNCLSDAVAGVGVAVCSKL